MTLLRASNHHARLTTHINLVQKLKHGAVPPFAYVSSCGGSVTTGTTLSLSYVQNLKVKTEHTHRISNHAHRVYINNLYYTVSFFIA